MTKKDLILQQLTSDYDAAVKGYRLTGSNKDLDNYAKSFIKLNEYKDILNSL